MDLIPGMGTHLEKSGFSFDFSIDNNSIYVTSKPDPTIVLIKLIKEKFQ